MLILLQALPSVISLVITIVRWLKIVTLEMNSVVFIRDLNLAFQNVHQAKTEDEKKAAARSIHDLISTI